MRGVAITASVALGIALVGPAAASAVTHYAAPANQGTGDCLSPQDACLLFNAIGGSPDEVVLAPGEYGSQSTPFVPITLLGGQTMHGPDTGPLPRVWTTGNGISLNGATLRRVNVEAGNGTSFTVSVNGGLLDRSVVHGGVPGSIGCSGFEGTITNTICRTDGSGINGGFALFGGTSGTTTMNFRNDTLIGTGGANGVAISMSGGGTNDFNFTNVIARGSGGVTTDTWAQGSGGSTLRLTFDHSNYATRTDAASTTTAPGSGTNQAAAALLGSDFRELAGSPTIAAGVTNAANGPVDLDGDPRSIGGLTDIGADELVSPISFSLAAAKVKVAKSGVAAVPFNCSASVGDTCTATGSLTATSKPRKAGGRASGKRKTRVVGSFSGSTLSGRPGTLAIKLTKPGKKLLRKRGKLRLSLAGTAGTTIGQTSPVTASLKLKLKKKKR